MALKQFLVWMSVVFGVYVLSYAPFIRFRYGPNPEFSRNIFVSPDFEHEYYKSKSHALFAPVEWLIDRTAADKTLMRWAELWEADHKIQLDSLSRELERTIGGRTWEDIAKGKHKR